MAQVLQEFLSLGLMEGVDSDETFNRLQEGAAELAGKLTASPGQLIPTVLVALDAEASANEPIFQQAEECILGKWKTFRSKYQDPPRALLRAVIWEALARATAGNARCSAITWLTGASVLPYARLGKEREAVVRVLQEAARAAEEAAVAAHVPPSGDKGLPLKLAQPKLPAVAGSHLNGEGVRPLVESALALPSAKASKNPALHALVNAQPPPPVAWADLSPRLSNVLVNVVNVGLETLAQKIEAANAKLTEFTVSSVKALANEVAGALGNHQRQADLRVSVLWWTEALYSPSLKVSYRTLPPAVAVIAMAYDLFDVVGAKTPASVAYLLAETVARLPSVSWTQKQALSSLLQELYKERQHLNDFVDEPKRHEGRRPLIDTVDAVVQGTPLTAEGFAARTGLSEGLQVSLPEFGMWCFRNLQARALAKEEAPG